MHFAILSVVVLLLMASMALALDPPTTRPTTQPTFIELPNMELGGIATFDSPQSGAFGRLWQKWPANVEGQPGVSTHPCYGVSVIVPSMKDKHEFTYVAAGHITDAAKAPQHLLRLTLPAGTYAVFPLKSGMPDGLKELGPMFEHIFKTWFPTSGYEMAAPYNVERYDSDKNTIEILIPVKKKG